MRPKSLRFATFAFPLRDAPYLPLTGELHPLRREAHRWVLWGNGISLSLAVLAVALGSSWWREPPDLPPPPEIVIQIKDLLPPPTIVVPTGPRIRPADVLARVGIPEPVPAAPDVPSDFATQDDLRNLPSVLDHGDLGNGAPIVLDVPEPAPEPTMTPASQDYPRLLRIDPPVYPSIALEAGIEGTVLVRVLVGVDGKAKECVFIAGNSILKEAALASARTAIFSPAMQHHEPVEVWVQIPVQFSLK